MALTTQNPVRIGDPKKLGSAKIFYGTATTQAGVLADVDTAPGGFPVDVGSQYINNSTGQIFVKVAKSSTPAATDWQPLATPNVQTNSIITSATPATTRLIHQVLEINSNITSVGGGGGSLTPIRGVVQLDANKTFGGTSFMYGIQGKAIINGTLNNGSGFCCGVLAQLDLSAIQGHTSGYLAPLIVDVGGIVGLATDANLTGIFISNNTACKINAMIKGNIKASYVFELSDSQGDYSWFADTAGTADQKFLKVLVNGTPYKIPLHANA